jgi:enterochelin esterase family protein
MLRSITCLFLLIALTATPAAAQLLAPPLSPTVHADGTLSLALKAPAADSVKASIHLGDTFDLARGEDGTWRADIGPLEPGIYWYAFEVDGTQTNGAAGVDPTDHRQNPGSVHRTVTIPADPPAFYEERDVPRGTLHHHRHRSHVLGDHRSYFVYTPPGYGEQSDRRYPVLYLLHGYSDSEASWSTWGRAGIILDNLIADGAVVPMILVMPRGYVSADESRGDAPTAGAMESAWLTAWVQWGKRLTPRVGEYIVDELVPTIDGSYRTLDEVEHRALAGLSMGGLQALYIGLRNTGRFGSVGAFSSGVFPPTHAWLLEDVVAPSLLWVACGTEDFLYPANKQFIARLEERGITHTTHLTDGGHGWFLWQRYLRDFAGLLFR